MAARSNSENGLSHTVEADHRKRSEAPCHDANAYEYRIPYLSCCPRCSFSYLYLLEVRRQELELGGYPITSGRRAGSNLLTC